ncbi:MAG UNVERIFIED_CONTAM: hypothetical protein LVQ98_00670 [Rickettsiaceae bacterium]
MSNFDFAKWKHNFINLGPKAIAHFADAVFIESNIKREILEGIPGITVDGLVPTTAQYFNEMIKRLRYTERGQDPKLADLYRKLGVTEAMFNAALEFRKIVIPKTQDNIPNISVDIRDGYYMVKLPSDDPRALVLGHITKCCQSIDGDSAQCVKDGVQLANNGFYVFIKAGKKGLDPQNIDWDNFETNGHQIVGQTYAWIGKNNSLVLDSIEVPTSFRSRLDLRETFKKFGQAVEASNPAIERVMLGTGGQTREVLEANNMYYVAATTSVTPEAMIEGTQYRDSFSQSEIYVSERLRDARLELKSRGMYSDSAACPSVSHANALLNHAKKDILTSSYYAKQICEKGYSTPEELAKLVDYEMRVIQVVMSTEAMVLYEGGYSTPEKLAKLNVTIDDIAVLTILPVMMLYRKGYTTPEELVKLSPQTIEILTDYSAMALYRNGDTTVTALSQCTPDQLNDLLSDQSMREFKSAYSQGVSFTDFAKSKGIDLPLPRRDSSPARVVDTQESPKSHVQKLHDKRTAQAQNTVAQDRTA